MYYFVYHINTIALYWEEKPTSLMNENKIEIKIFYVKLKNGFINGLTIPLSNPRCLSYRYIQRSPLQAHQGRNALSRRA